MTADSTPGPVAPPATLSDANADSDIDILIDFELTQATHALPIFGLSKQVSELIDHPADVFCRQLLKSHIYESAIVECIPL